MTIKTEISPVFNEILLDGVFAYSFGEMFETAQDVLDMFPKCVVKFNFNGYIVNVSTETPESAWEKYVAGELPKIKED